MQPRDAKALSRGSERCATESFALHTAAMRTLLFASVLFLTTSASAAGAFVNAGDGVRLWYEVRGKGSPIIVIHGGPGMDHETLAADLVPLEKNHRVIYYDQRGGGRSTLPADTALLTMDHHIRDLEALRQHL
jgi:proline iminopeptidase